MARSKVDTIEIIKEVVCDFCYSREEQSDVARMYFTKSGTWVGGYSKKKSEEVARLTKQWQQGKTRPCIMMQDSVGREDEWVFICPEHLELLVKRMNSLR